MLTFINKDSNPAYLALSTDINIDNKIAGANLVGKVVYLTDTQTSKIIGEDLTLSDYSQGGSGGATTFIQLTDVPNTYTGSANKVVSVKSTADGLEFTTNGSGTVTPTGSITANHLAVFNDTTGNVIKDGGAVPTGNVTGVASSVATNLPIFSDTTGKAISDSGILISTIDPYGIHHRLSGSNAADDEFVTDTSSNYTIVTPSGSANWVVANHVASCLFSGQSANDLCAFLKPVTLSDGQMFETSIKYLTKTASFTMGGLVVTDGTSTTSNALASIVYYDNTGIVLECEIWTGTLTNMTTAASFMNLDSASSNAGIRLRLKRNSSTSFTSQYGLSDGSQYGTFGAGNVNPAFTPTHAGLFVSTWGGTQTALISYDFIRIY